MTSHVRTVLLSVFGMLIGHGVVAQSKPTVAISGVVRDSSGRPLEAAEVWLVGGGKTVTGADGIFRFVGIKNPVRSWISARHIGHFPIQTSITADPGAETALTIVMAAQPVTLPELTVRAAEQVQRRRLIDFVWRSRGGGGRFLSREDIERARVSELGHLVIRYLPFKNPTTMDQPGGWGENGSFAMETTDGSSFPDIAEWNRAAAGGYYLSTIGGYNPSANWRGSWGTRDCPPAVALNGGSISPGRAVNDFEPSEIEALEIYQGRFGLPFEYSMGGRSSCGLIVIWLKSFVPAP